MKEKINLFQMSAIKKQHFFMQHFLFLSNETKNSFRNDQSVKGLTKIDGEKLPREKNQLELRFKSGWRKFIVTQKIVFWKEFFCLVTF
jgi:hypothetical protein